MTSESKILTVSYGTFSCTLEGFDDPFDTMKAIAEYFRDLAAQDRHFGAEPPPPDAAMLHRLAEREVSRLATARAAGAPAPAGAETAESPVAPRIQLNPANRRSAPPVVEPAAPVAADGGTPEPSLTDVIPDGVAAKLARIRRSVHPAMAEAATRDDVTAFDAAPSPAEAAEAAPVPVEALEDAAAAVEAPADAAALAAEEIADPVAPQAADPQDDPDAARFVALDDAETDATVAEADADASADEPVEAMAFAADTTLADEAALSDLSDAEDLALLAELDGIAQEEAEAAALRDDPLPEDQPEAPTLADAAALDPLPEAADEAADEAPVEALADILPDADILPEAAVEASVDEAAPAEPDAEPVADAGAKPGKRGRRNSRVIRLHPDSTPDEDYDFGATRVLSANGESDEVARLMQQAEEVMADDDNRRRQEALSRLKAAVVSTEADRADIDYEAPKADAKLDPWRDDLAEAIQPDPIPEPLPEPEVKPSRRKSVTIRPAEPRPGTIRPGMISPPPLVLVSEQRIDRVAPAQAPAPAPAATPAAAFSPAAAGITPSIPDGQPMVALRTGRLSGAIGAGAAVATSGLPARNIVLEKPSYGPAADAEEDEDLAEDAKEIDGAGFASFAELVGARSMAEMLEAAAAYATCIEKRSQFTRPQLMRRMMASAGGKPVSREDGLRSFGTLLRTGRIEKITRGHYSLAENSPYLAEARRLS